MREEPKFTSEQALHYTERISGTLVTCLGDALGRIKSAAKAGLDEVAFVVDGRKVERVKRLLEKEGFKVVPILMSKEKTTFKVSW